MSSGKTNWGLWCVGSFVVVLSILGLWAIHIPKENLRNDVTITEDVQFTSTIAKRFLIDTKSGFGTIILKFNEDGSLNIDGGNMAGAPLSFELILTIKHENGKLQTIFLTDKKRILLPFLPASMIKGVTLNQLSLSVLVGS
jgi:hypothetical protein